MKKLVIVLVSMTFVIAAMIVGWVFVKESILDNNKPKTVAEIERAEYLKKYEKLVSTEFMIDSVAYTVGRFEYYPKKDTVSLFVDVEIQNRGKRIVNFDTTFFELQSEHIVPKIYYPIMRPFEMQPAQTRKLKLRYILPEMTIPYLHYYLNMKTVQGSSEQAVVSLFKNYREGG
jgi:hypothetical protein